MNNRQKNKKNKNRNFEEILIDVKNLNEQSNQEAKGINKIIEDEIIKQEKSEIEFNEKIRNIGKFVNQNVSKNEKVQDEQEEIELIELIEQEIPVEIKKSKKAMKKELIKKSDENKKNQIQKSIEENKKVEIQQPIEEIKKVQIQQPVINKSVVKEVKEVKEVQLDLEKEFNNSMKLIIEKTTNKEKNSQITNEGKIKTLVDTFEEKYNEIIKDIENIENIKKTIEINSSLKGIKRKLEKTALELSRKQEEIIETYNVDLAKEEARKAKELLEIEKDFKIDKTVLKRDITLKQYKREYEQKFTEIKEKIKLPSEIYEEATNTLENLEKKYFSDKEEITERLDAELDEQLKQHKGDKLFTKLDFIIPEDKTEELSRMILEQGKIDVEYFKQFEKLSRRDILVNKYEQQKAYEINEKNKIFVEESQIQKEIIVENKAIIDAAKEEQRKSVEEYNKKVEMLNANISKANKENDMKVERAEKLKNKDIDLENFEFKAVKVSMVKEKIAKKQVDNIFTKMFKFVKNSETYKNHVSKKQEKTNILKEKQNQKIDNTINNTKQNLQNFRSELNKKVNTVSNFSIDNNNKKYEDLSLEI